MIAKKVDSGLSTTCCGSYRRMKKDSGDVDVLIGGKKVIKFSLLQIVLVYYK